MSKKNYTDDEVTSGNWNIASSYTRELILKCLLDTSKYRRLAVFGFDNLQSDIFIRDENLKNTSRLHSLKRLIHSIIFLINSTNFAVKKTDKEEFKKYLQRLARIKKSIHRLRIEKKRGNRVSELNINEDLFDKIIEDIDVMDDDIKYRLNQAGLIFTPEEEFDIRKTKDEFKDRYINRR